MALHSYNSLRDIEPMCALDPLLFIPRIEYVESILEFLKADSANYTLIIMDMKNFHAINDLYDYSTGDIVLSEFILLLRIRLPRGAISLRFRHGDEFLFFLPGEKKEAEKLFFDFKEYCEQYSFLKKPNGDNFTVSFHFASVALPGDMPEPQEILLFAESKLREVKGQGSSRIN